MSPAATRFADFYHERTNFQFIKHSPALADPLEHRSCILSLVRCSSRGLNLGIEFEGGTSWQVTDGRRQEREHRRTSATSSTRSGSPTPRSASLAGQGDESVRVQAEVVEDPIRTIQGTLADVRPGLEPADVQFVRNEDGGGTFTFTVPTDAAVTQESIETALDRRRADATRPSRSTARTYTVQLDDAADEPGRRTSRSRSPTYAGVDVSEVSVEHRRTRRGARP